jgi:PRA1 family protein 1
MKRETALISGHEITLFHQYCVIGVFSLVLFYYTGAGDAFMWVLGASLFLILLHAAFFGIEDEGQEFAFQLEEV